MFVGLFRARFRPDARIDWSDQLTGESVGHGRSKPYFYFECEQVGELADEVGTLFVDWGASLRQWSQYAARHDKLIIDRGGISADRRRVNVSMPVEAA
jgi:hypothetical protein